MKKFFPCFILALFISVGLFADWDIGELLLASDGAEHDEFGKSVSISGNYAVIGALANDENGSNSGSAYIFYYEDNNWYQQAKLTSSDGTDLDLFGKSVSISGNYVMIGATGNDDNGSCSGSAYIFSRNDTIWTEQAKLIASDAATENHFGYSVSISGDYAVIGAMGNDENGTHAGAAYIFYRSGTIWSQQAKLLASDGSANDIFGKSVAIFDDYVIIGAGSVDSNGFCYIYKRNGTSWTEQAKLVASDGASQDLFGYSVSIFDNYAVIGACGDDDNGSYSGSTYIFIRSDITWTQQVKLTASDGTADNYFGYSVSIFDDDLVIGAFSDDDNGISSGSAYVFQNDDILTVVADFEANPVSGLAPLEVQFTDLSTCRLIALMSITNDEDNHTNSAFDELNKDRNSSRDIDSWEWDFDNDGTIDSNEQNPLYSYSEAGLYTVSLTVSDGTSIGK